MRRPSCLLVLGGVLALAGCGRQAPASTDSAPTAIHATPSPYTPSHRSAAFTGTVTRDTCANPTTGVPVGDIGCALAVNGNTVEIVHGNMLYPNGWGKVRGFSPFRDDVVGRTVEVDARHRGPLAYDLGCLGCFVRLAR
jgi:hypothetical protein